MNVVDRLPSRPLTHDEVQELDARSDRVSVGTVSLENGVSSGTVVGLLLFDVKTGALYAVVFRRDLGGWKSVDELDDREDGLPTP